MHTYLWVRKKQTEGKVRNAGYNKFDDVKSWRSEGSKLLPAIQLHHGEHGIQEEASNSKCILVMGKCVLLMVRVCVCVRTCMRVCVFVFFFSSLACCARIVCGQKTQLLSRVY